VFIGIPDSKEPPEFASEVYPYVPIEGEPDHPMRALPTNKYEPAGGLAVEVRLTVAPATTVVMLLE
jgi:hypothetical protein